MALVKMSDVSRVSADTLLGCSVDQPKADTQSELYAINITGWVLGQDCPAVAVEAVHDRMVLQRVPVNGHRPDVAAVYPNGPVAMNSGFRLPVSVLGLPARFELLVRAVLQDDRRIPFAVLRGQRQRLCGDFSPQLQPLILSTHGRSGSTWVTHLLGQHPQIITYRPFEYETRVGNYWIQILKTLSEPASYLHGLATEFSDSHWWLGAHPPVAALPVTDPGIGQQLGQETIEALAAFCQARIEAFYQKVAAVQGRPQAKFFCEKFSPGDSAQLIISELYLQTREIFLVRDFRDQVCSILAYNAKRGATGFGRAQVDSDADFVRQWQGHALGLLRTWKSRSSQAYLLRYEDLIQYPEETLSAVLDYLNLASDPATVQQALQQAMERAPEQQRSHQTSTNPAASIGRWRRELPVALQTVCQETFDEIVHEFGYER
jgi:hypothetical protein